MNSLLSTLQSQIKTSDWLEENKGVSGLSIFDHDPDFKLEGGDADISERSVCEEEKTTNNSEVDNSVASVATVGTSVGDVTRIISDEVPPDMTDVLKSLAMLTGNAVDGLAPSEGATIMTSDSLTEKLHAILHALESDEGAAVLKETSSK